MNKLLLTLLVTLLGFGLASCETAQQSPPQAKAAATLEGPDPQKICSMKYSVVATVTAQPIVILRAGDYDCKVKPCSKIPIVVKPVMKPGESQPSGCVGVMHFDRILVPEDDREAGTRLKWVLMDESGNPAKNFEFDEKEGIKVVKDRKNDFSDGKRERSPQEFSYKNAHKEDCDDCRKDRKNDACRKCRRDRADKKDWSTACFQPKVWLNVPGQAPISCDISDPLIWNQ
jgi:hypothetical protein